MIDSAKNYEISAILKTDSNVRYQIPKYQRKYTWSKDAWEALFDDVHENPRGHFLGSIICIKTTQDALAEQQELDLVDGQQRLTTISLLYAAVHNWLNDRKQLLDDDGLDDLRDIKRRLVLKRSNQIRVSPSYHGNNHDDYKAVLCLAGVLPDIDTPPFAGVRRIIKAYRYFSDRLEATDNNQQPLFNIAAVLDLLEKLNNASVVKIEVSSHADAYTLFESLNNRGVPLSAIDLIKNKLLSSLEKQNIRTLDENFDRWNSLLENLTDNYSVQERFLRQFYNAFRYRDDIAVQKVPIATRSKIIHIYEALIERNADETFDELRQATKLYNRLINPDNDKNSASLTRQLQALERIGGTPAYTFLLFLLKKGVADDVLVQIIRILVCFFVKRSVTDVPPTRDLDRMFMELVGEVSNCEIVDPAFILEFIRKRSASDELFAQQLKGDIYDNNVGATRFILCSLEETQQTLETMTDLWARGDKNLFIWTVEHIFPQGENIPKAWVDMIADGDSALAKQRREEYVHKLGNLTLTGFNSKLGTLSFSKKRDRKDRSGKIVGFKNGLNLNKQLAEIDAWSVEQIESRTATLVEQTVKLFDYDELL